MLLLTGDIGGTKTILRLVEADPQDKSFKSIREQKYVSASFPDLVPIVEDFLAAGEQETPESACFAIAGPVIDNNCRLTNLSWDLSGNRLEKELNIGKVRLINDFAANSYGVLGLKDTELATIQTGEINKNAPIAVIGAGTGLGQSFLIPQGEIYQVFATEGGHTDFAPRNDLEFDLLKYLQAKLNTSHISVERIASGQGIISIYQFLRDANFAAESSAIGESISRWEQETAKTIDPAAIISQGAANGDELCAKTMNMFIEAYGAETGNMALKLLPYGGMYIAGGIAAKNLSLMQDGNFLAAFQDKGRMKSLMERIPLHVVLNSEVGLLGAILYLLNS
ncbi:glucokinase [Xenococcus sp. PCC 7305]|uniref:glucokinase n=1 Tax=Xenococcus sp. PCC 7305 TaxID=102125 RepID=UPI0002AC41E2|nr:glucokinase [Xenococcus sp. PCC 7305]ELS01556.1 glucokinase [Xenococcus sp. PCC 7305]